MTETDSDRVKRRFPIRFDNWYRLLSTALLLPPSSSYVEIDGGQVYVRMGWAFQSRFPRLAVASTTELRETPLSHGVHGFAGRWLVNGSGQGIVSIELNPPQRGYVMGFPVRLRVLMVSVSDPVALAGALTRGFNCRGKRGVWARRRND
jgi:hypothetical protein